MEQNKKVMNEEVVATEETKVVVNCPKCSAALKVSQGSYAYMCPVCSGLFRVRKCERIVKDVSRETMMEAFVNVNQD